MKAEKNIKPTESELEILSVLWNLKQGTVRAVHDIISKNKECGYTTTLKLMQIMHEKKLVSRDDSKKSHVYKPAVTKEKTQGQFLSNLISHLFSGSGSQLVLQTLGNHQPNTEELKQIEDLIKEIKREREKQ